MARVLVAGASGYLGSHVVAACKRRGHHVRALVRDRARLGRRGAAADEVFVGEITVPATLARACDGVDAVFSSVGITRQRDGLGFRDVDYQGNLNLLAVALAARVPRFVYTSICNGEQLRALAIVRAQARMNPIDGADLAEVAVNALERGGDTIAAGVVAARASRTAA